MSKAIKITQQYIEEIRREFDKSIENIRISDGKFTFSKTLTDISRRAELIFTEKANRYDSLSYLKCQF